MQRKLTVQELAGYLERLCESEAFEILSSSEENVAIPYIMNDAGKQYTVKTMDEFIGISGEIT